MKYLLIAIINTIYGTLLFLTLTSDTPGFSIVFVIAGILLILGTSGIIFYLKAMFKDREHPTESDALKGWFQITRSFDTVLVIGLIFRALVLQPFVVDGNSMEPNFQDKQALMVDKVTFKARLPRRGEAVIFRAPTNPSEDYIKRLIGFPGETVMIVNGQVYINGRLFSENYINDPGQTYINSDKNEVLRKTLGPNEYFVMGDNRLHSSDSREWGTVPKINLVGRPLFSVYPWRLAGLIATPQTNF